MTPEQARDALVTALQTTLTASLPTLKVYHESGKKPDLDQVGSAFLYVKVDFTGAKQASVESNPLTRVTGELCLNHFQKSGEGVKALLARAETLNSAMKHRNLSGLQTTTPRPGNKEEHDGWYSQEWVIPFYFTQ